MQSHASQSACNGPLGSNNCFLNFCIYEFHILFLLGDNSLFFRGTCLANSAQGGQHLLDIFQLVIIDDEFALDVDDFLARRRIVHLRLVNTELRKSAKRCLKYLHEARVHVFDQAIIVQFLNTQMQLCYEFALLNGYAHFL